MKKILFVFFLTLSLSVNAKWSQSPIGLYDLFHSEGSEVIDISISDGKQISKIFTTLKYDGDLYRCVQMIFDAAQAKPKTEHCWILVPD
jgi:hypothetical protein